MARFPVDGRDVGSIAAAVNYALSGPGSLGQDYSGVSFSDPGWLTGNFAPAFTSPTAVSVSVAAITCSLAEKLSANTFKYTFSVAQPSPPFFIGANITASGFTPNQYNRTFVLGVVECTTTYVIARTRRPLGNPGNSTVAGTVALNFPQAPVFNATDGDIRDIKITGGNEKAFVSAQLLNTITYSATVASTLEYTVAINRYTARPTNDPNDLDFTYLPANSVTIASRTYTIATTATGTGLLLDPIDTVFVNVIDSPETSLIRYILEIQVETTVGDLAITQCEFGYRSLSCQVIKQ
jgi:hypothetical protein